ncbi:MAG: DUF3179 domain-containing protein [Chloroflexi bacterium]|nr:DUF3179 domain-containing protein [Chloroflexota bacterium]
MVHDRRIDGETQIFGNAGGLFMNAMTWYDHETESIWSQPWGRAIQGELKGVELFPLPFQLTTWASWKAEHPQTLAMMNDVQRLNRRQGFNPDFVIGLILADEAKAYYYRDVSETIVVNDVMGSFPVVVWAANNNFHAYIRQVDEQALTFKSDGDKLIDNETGSTWDLTNGLAIDGPLTGQGLTAVPSMSAFDWAWEDFYPDTEFYNPSLSSD